MATTFSCISKGNTDSIVIICEISGLPSAFRVPPLSQYTATYFPEASPWNM